MRPVQRLYPGDMHEYNQDGTKYGHNQGYGAGT